MFYIEEFTVENLAGRPEVLKRKLDRSTNIFWGLNGRGKTTLMSIINLALHNKTTEINRLPFTSASIVLRSDDLHIRIVRSFKKSRDNSMPEIDDDPSDEFSLSSDSSSPDEFIVPEFNDDQDSWFDSYETIDENGNVDREIRGPISRRPRVAHMYLPITRISEGILSRFPVHTRDPRHRESDADHVDLRFVNQVKRAWSFYNSKSNAKIRDVQQEGLAEVLAILFGGPVLDYLDRSAQIKSDDSYDLVKSFLAENNIDLQISKMTFIERYEESQEHRAVVGKIEEVRNKVDTILRPQKELQNVIDQMFIGNKHLVFNKSQQRIGRPFSDSIEITVDGSSIPLWALSSGEKQLLQLLLQVLSAGQSIVMIDEPEISLHVDWQERIVNSMRRINPDAQLLLTTHSPEIMVHIEDDCVFEL
ncbi:AAA family ATPase [Rhodococcus erythropolis]|uniref:AAA family ATPase n=1 Tax=Rhodococcus erythropolis TaxID=1833 RepID=UPI0029491362|nr:AAA family ATPase [Rhodococcus erythropolis]MDV6211780.1 AAA family ATPase [Rhodococcus erythropolis]